MRITVDTNVLVRLAVRDDVKQVKIAGKILANATLIVITLPCLCEFIWVLLRTYQFERADAALAIRTLLTVANVEVNRPAVEAGISVLEAGGHFADGVIAYEGNWLGGTTFVSFDKKAVALLAARGQSTKLI